MRYLALILLFSLLQGCANPYARFYTPAPQSGQNIVKATEPPRLVRGSAHPEQDAENLMENNYREIGYSSFNGAQVDESDAINQAKDVGANIVVVYSKYSITVTGEMPLTLPSTQTSTTNVSGTVGTTPVYGTANTTTHGTTTTYIPYSVRRNDYLATYWVKAPTPIFGAFIREPTADERKQIGSNTGLILAVVIKNSPTFNADLFKGDVLKRVGDIQLTDLQGFKAAMLRYAGQKVNVVVLRDGKPLTCTAEMAARK